MGLYGSQPLQAPDYCPKNPWKQCQYCGNQYQGNYCPICGTKAGEKKPLHIAIWKLFALVLLGALLEFAISMALIYFIRR